MALIPHPIPWDSLPQEFAPIDQRWIDRRLKSLYLLAPGTWNINQVTGKVGGTVTGSGPFWTGNRLRVDGTTSNYITLEHGLTTNLAAPLSIVVGCVNLAGSGTSWSVMRSNASASGWVMEATGEVRTYSSGAVNGSLSLGADGNYAFSHRSTVDLTGASRSVFAQDTSAANGTFVSRTGISLGVLVTNVVNAGAESLFTHFAAFDGELTDAELLELANTPERLFAPRTIWVPASAVGTTNYSVTLTEAATATDSCSVLIGYAPVAAEAGSAADVSSILAALSAAAAETAAALDAITALHARTVSLTESATAADTVNGTAAGDYAGTVAEAGSAADTSSNVAAFAHAVAEAGAAADTASQVAALSGTASETATALDTVNGTATGDFAGTVTEAGSAADTASNVASLNATATEAATAADSLAAARAVSALIAEAMSAADSVSASAAGDYFGVVSEAGSAIDTASQTAAMFGTVAELTTATDASYVFNAWLASIIETATAADAASQILNAVVANSAWWTYEVAPQNLRYSVAAQSLIFEIER